MYNSYDEIADIIDVFAGHTGPSQSRWLFDLVKQMSNDAWVCEVGTNYGRLSAAMALASVGSNRRVVTVDHMIGGYCERKAEDGINIYEQVIDGMIWTGAWEKIVPLPIKSLQAHEFILTMKRKLALVYLDGDHSYDNVLAEMISFGDLIEIGGIICGDDCFTAQIQHHWPIKFLEALETLPDAELTLFATTSFDPTGMDRQELLLTLVKVHMNQNISSPEYSFLEAWPDSDRFRKHPVKTVADAIFSFFYENSNYEAVEAPGNQFAFRKISEG